jgi:hypothetical protein
LLYYQRYEKYLKKPNNMPIPKPTASESQNEYVGRCMHEIASEYDTNEQAVAICINTYQKGTMSKSTEQRVADKLSGIHLLAGLEDSCWEGYIAIGTKDKDGKTVPNCVPVEEEAAKVQMEKKYNFAEGDGSYPWDECVIEQTDRYGSKDIAEKVCGMIKSKYGS